MWKIKPALPLTLETTMPLKMVDYLYQRFGRIDVFINNAGFGEFKSYDNYTSQGVRDMFDINTFATMSFSRLMAEKMVGTSAMAISSSTSPVWRENCDSQLVSMQRQSLRYLAFQMPWFELADEESM